MPRKSKNAMSTQKIWEERINRAKQVKSNWKELFKVQQALEYLDGKQRPTNYDASEWITINNVYSHLKAQLPSLYSNDPYFHVKIKRSYVPVRQVIEQYEKKAKVRQSNLNYYKDELELKPKARLAIQDAMFAFGVLRVEHVSTMIENPDKGKAIKREQEESQEDAEDMVDESGQPLMEPDFIPVNSRYNIARVHFDDFLFDEDAGPLKDSWAWVAERMRVPYDDVAANPMFKKSAVKALKGRSTEKEDEENKDREDRKKGDIKGSGGRSYFKFDEDAVEPEICILWKIWDLKKKKWLVIGEGGDEPLVAESDLPKGVEKHPYAILRFTMRDDSPYPIPPMSQGIDPAHEYNVARSDIMKHRKRFNRKYEVFTGAFDDAESEISKLEHGDDGTCLKVNMPNVKAVQPIQDAQLDQMRWQEMGYLKNEMIELFGGSTGESRGIAEADSATQAGILDSRMQMKEGDALSLVIDFTKDLARKLDQLIQAHIDAVQAVRVTGSDGIDYMETITPGDYSEIQGEYIYEVNVGSTMPRLPQMERASFNAVLSLFANAPWLMSSKRLIKRVLEMHHMEDDTLADELFAIGQKMMQAQQQEGAPGKTGSIPGVGEQNPVAAMGGQYGGAAAPQNPAQ